MTNAVQHFNRRLNVRKVIGKLFYGLFFAAVVLGLLGLVVLLIQIFLQGLPWLNWNFITSYPSRHADQAGLLSALMGSVWLIVLTALICIPVGVGAAIHLEEYAPKTWVTQIIEINISNLAGVPSIVYGLLGLTLFVSWMSLGRSVLAGALTMSLLVLPIIILASREAIRAVPGSHRQAAYALGATQFQVITGVVLPTALPGILTGTILAMSRAIGEAAPMIAISALVYIRFVPGHPMDRFTVMPIQIFNWVSRPQHDFAGLAAAGIIVLLFILLSMNAVAVFLRNRSQQRSEE